MTPETLKDYEERGARLLYTVQLAISALDRITPERIMIIDAQDAPELMEEAFLEWFRAHDADTQEVLAHVCERLHYQEIWLSNPKAQEAVLLFKPEKPN